MLFVILLYKTNSRKNSFLHKALQLNNKITFKITFFLFFCVKVKIKNFFVFKKNIYTYYLCPILHFI